MLGAAEASSHESGQRPWPTTSVRLVSIQRHYNPVSLASATPHHPHASSKPDASDRLKVLVINQSFWPDVVATAQQAHDLAKYLTARGDEVTVVSSRSLYGQQGATLTSHERADGVEIHRVSRNLFQKRGLLTRAVDYVRFGLACLFKCLTLPRQDVVICLTTPPFIALVGVALRLIKGSRFVLWSMDLYPDLPAQAGIIRRGGVFHRMLRLVDLLCLRSADKIVVLGSCMYERIRAKRIAPSRIAMIHPWSDPSEISDRSPEVGPPGEPAFREAWSIGDRFVVEYSGNYGLGHDVATVAAAMLRMKDDDGIRWVIVGDGIMKSSIVAFVREHGIANVIFQPYQPRSSLGPLIRMGDVHLVLLLPGYEGVILPSKLYGILAAARPVVFVGPAGSEVARVIEQESCGFVVRNGDDARLVEVIEALRHEPEIRSVFGARGRAALEGKYSRMHACTAWHDILHQRLRDRESDRSRYRQVAELHAAGINSGFLSGLGREFLSVLYRSIDESPQSVLHTEEQGDRVVGFVAGTTGTVSLLRGLLWHLPSTLWSLRASLLRPDRLLGMIRVVGHMRQQSRTGEDRYPRAELLSISVSPEARGTGVAERLYRRLEAFFQSRAIGEFRIVVGSTLEPARRFYARMGARDVGEVQVHADRPSRIYVASVPAPLRKDPSS